MTSIRVSTYVNVVDLMRRVTYWTIHISLLLLVIFSRFDAAVISVALLVVVFSNLGSGESSSPYSAYSIFNKGCRYLLGEARADQLDKQIRGGGGSVTRQEESSLDFLNIPSKYINRPCPCGSGLKAKKCHAKRRAVAKSSLATSNTKEDDYDYTGFEVVEQ
jgi:hypothetical protein